MTDSDKPSSNPQPQPQTKPVAPPLRPYKPELDQLVERGGPKKVPLPDWLKK